METVTIPEELRRIGELMRTQDNQCTADPIFMVERKRITTGIDTDYCDGDDQIAWFIEDCMIFKGDEGFAELEAGYNCCGMIPRDYTRTGFSYHWEYVQPFFTQSAADAYIKHNGHKHDGELRVSVESAYRNNEFQVVRDWLMSLPSSTTPPATKDPA